MGLIQARSGPPLASRDNSESIKVNVNKNEARPSADCETNLTIRAHSLAARERMHGASCDDILVRM